MESDEGGDIVDIFEDENEAQADGTENKESTNDTSTGTKVPVPKRIIKNPRLKFNPDRLCGERGIPVLVDHFKNVKFKGKDHEKEDLDKLLSHLEHWTHRLFPSMKFEDCLNQIEKLGKKRPVQTCLRKIRLDQPILSNDFIENDDDDDDNVLRNDDPEPPSNEDAFDKLIQESQDILNSNTSNNFDYMSTTTYLSPLPTPAAGQVLGSSFGSSLTDEQKERMERNKMLAAERRKARLSALQTNTSALAQEDDKMVDSQVSVTYDSSLDQPNSSVKENNFDAITRSTSIENINNENDTSILSDQTSEKLGLDELVDFIDEEPEPSKKLVFDDSNSSDNFTKNTDKDMQSINRISDDECIEIGCGASDINKKIDDSISGIVYDKMENDSSDNDIKSNNNLDCNENMNTVHTVSNTTVNNSVEVLNDTSSITDSISDINTKTKDDYIDETYKEILNDTLGITESVEDSISDINAKTNGDYKDVDEALYKEDHTLNVTTNGSTKVINNESDIIENMDYNVSNVGVELGDISEKDSENGKCLKYNADLENDVLIQKKMSVKDCVDVNMDDDVSGAVKINLGNCDTPEKGIEANDDCLGLDELMDLVDE